MRNRHVIAALAGALLLAGCGGSATSSPGVPALSQAAGQGSPGQGSSARAAALHAAAQCIRQHGIPSYADPVLTASGQVYTDSRSMQDASQPVLDAVYHACSALAARAGLNPSSEPSAPTAQTAYTPGHGFGFTRGEIPAGGKLDPAYQAAAHACRALLDAEIRASTLASLGNDG